MPNAMIRLKNPSYHPEAKAFTKVIKDNPQDFTARMVYHDWLKENGFHEHAHAVKEDLYGTHADMNKRADRGVLLHESGIDPARGWHTELITRLPSHHFGETLKKHGVSDELAQEMSRKTHSPGAHPVIPGDALERTEHGSEVHHDENWGYVVEHSPKDKTLTLSRRLA